MGGITTLYEKIASLPSKVWQYINNIDLEQPNTSIMPYGVVSQSNNEKDAQTYNYARVTPSMAIIIVVLIAVLFIMGCVSIYIRHCSEDTANGSLRPVGMGGLSRRAAASRGLDPAVIERFPTLVYSVVKGLKIGKGALECAVCLNEFEEDEKLRLIPNCDHVFHPDCIGAWLESHSTCPVCRADLTVPADSVPQLRESHDPELDLEAQNGSVMDEPENGNANVEAVGPETEVVGVSVVKTLNRVRTRGSRSGRPLRFTRSHSTGHSVVQPGENTDRFTLRLPVDVRKQVMNRKLSRAMSMVVLSRQGSSVKGNKSGVGEGSPRKMVNYKRLEKLDREARSDRWVFNRNPSFLARASSFLSRASSSVLSPKVSATDNRGDSSGQHHAGSSSSKWKRSSQIEITTSIFLFFIFYFRISQDISWMIPRLERMVQSNFIVKYDAFIGMNVPGNVSLVEEKIHRQSRHFQAKILGIKILSPSASEIPETCLCESAW
ncbi:hypothetical protein SADUNF_Sadunf05G0020800 [Salix dunnii]|uniref:RING-type E3 ubiquitin transferase n=1 Tax=Salix dunnii TaxID=1413687 RepID=A0A835MY74_9ROSI|nr:hypothetical protein SADUNF_Sadunf05G0020800 [Salix dunnii]